MRAQQPTRLPDGTVKQAEKLFALAGEFQAELEKIAGEANYPDNDSKEITQRIVLQRRIVYQRSRLALAEFQREKSRSTLLTFLQEICGPSVFGPCVLTDAPSFSTYKAAKWEGLKLVDQGGTVKYANATRLESMENEFNVLLLSMLKEIR